MENFKHDIQYAEAVVAEMFHFTTLLTRVKLYHPNCMVEPCKYIIVWCVLTNQLRRCCYFV